MQTLAIYLVPAPATHFYQLATALTGYDVLRGELAPPLLTAHYAAADAWSGIARLFGCHSTMGEAVAYADDDLDEIHTRLAWIAERTPPITLYNGRFYDTFALLPRSVGVTYDDPAQATARLHWLVVTLIQVLHAGSPFFAPHLDTFSEADRLAFYRYGVPRYRMLENFDLHFSLLSRLPDWQTRQNVLHLLRAEYGLFASERSLHLDTLYLLAQHPDRHFRVLSSFPLHGRA